MFFNLNAFRYSSCLLRPCSRSRSGRRLTGLAPDSTAPPPFRVPCQRTFCRDSVIPTIARLEAYSQGKLNHTAATVSVGLAESRVDLLSGGRSNSPWYQLPKIGVIERVVELAAQLEFGAFSKMRNL